MKMFTRILKMIKAVFTAAIIVIVLSSSINVFAKGGAGGHGGGHHGSIGLGHTAAPHSCSDQKNCK